MEFKDILIETVQSDCDPQDCQVISGWQERLNDLTDEQQRAFRYFVVQPGYTRDCWFIHARLADEAQS